MNFLDLKTYKTLFLQAVKSVSRERFYVLLFCLVASSWLFMRVSVHEETVADPVRVASAYELGDDLISEETLVAALEEGRASARVLVAFVYAVIISGFVGLIILLKIIVKYFSGHSILTAARAPQPVPWTLFDVGKVVLLFTFFGYAVSFCAGVIFHAWKVPLPSEQTLMVFNTTLLDCIGVIIIIRFVAYNYNASLTFLGLRFSEGIRALSQAFKYYLALIPILALTMVITLWIAKVTRYEPPPQPLFELFYGEENQRFLIASFFFVALLGPILEEIFFRGFAYPAFKARFGMVPGMVITAGLFSLLHGTIIGAVPIFFLGLLFVYLYEKTGSLIPSIAVHMVHNAVLTGLVLVMRDLSNYSL